MEIEINDKRQLVSKHHCKRVPVRPSQLQFDNSDIDVFITQKIDSTNDCDFGGGGNSGHNPPAEIKIEPKSPKYEPKSDVKITPVSTDCQETGTIEKPVVDSPAKSNLTENDDLNCASTKSGGLSDPNDINSTPLDTPIEIGEPVSQGEPSPVNPVAPNSSSDGESNTSQVDLAQSKEREPREENKQSEKDTVLTSATQKKKKSIITKIDNVFDVPRSSSDPCLRRGRPRQNLNQLTAPDIIDVTAPRSKRNTKEPNRFGDNIYDTKKKK